MVSMENRIIELVVLFMIGSCAGYLLHHIIRIEECRTMKKSIQAQQYRIDEDIIKNGEKQSYRDRYGNPPYRYNFHHGEFSMCHNDKIIYTMLMTNKFKVYDIAFDVYHDLVDIDYSYREHIDQEMFLIGIDYLRYGANNGSLQCLLTLSELYAEGILLRKDPLLADSLNTVYDKEYERAIHFK